jgi:cytochrome c oxidase subunit 1
MVYRGPYEYGSPEVDIDYYPQTQPPKDEKGEGGEETSA